MLRSLLLVVLLAAAGLMAWRAQTPPHPLPADAAEIAFSADRAMPDVRIIAAEPHPVGSAAQARTRDYLVSRMTALGLNPQIHRAAMIEVQPTQVEGAHIENLVGVLPGLDRTGPGVLLMAHRDAVRGSPGAADDASGVAAVLEIVRALRASGTPSRDVIVLLSDGEEDGLLGARAFAAEHPLARRVGFAINLESRGSAGRALMFETGARNGETIALFRRAAPYPVSNSLLAFAYSVMTNDTDFTPFNAAGVQGLNFAFMGGEFDYHSPSSVPSVLDRGSLQDLGQQGLAVAHAAAFAPALPKPAPNLAYGEIAGRWLIAYPPLAGWLLVLVTAVSIGLGIRSARRIGPVRLGQVAAGAALSLYAPLLAAVALRGARRLFEAEAEWTANAAAIEGLIFLLGLAILLAACAAAARGRRTAVWLAAAISIAALAAPTPGPLDIGLAVAALVLGWAASRKPLDGASAWAGALLVGLIVILAVQIAVPSGAPVLAWPITLAALAGAVSALGRRQTIAASAVKVFFVVAGLAMAAGLAHLVFLALGADVAEALAAALWIVGLLLMPFAWPREDERTAIVAPALIIVLCAAGLLWQGLRWPYSAARPQPAQMVLITDEASGQSWRASGNVRISDWMDGVLTDDGGRIERKAFAPFYDAPASAAPARPVASVPPQISLVRQPDGAVRLTILKAKPGLLLVDVRTNVAVSGTTIVGRPAPILRAAGQWSRIEWDAGPLELTVTPAGPGVIDLRFADAQPDWPQGAKPLLAPPADILPAGVHGSHVVIGVRRLAIP